MNILSTYEHFSGSTELSTKGAEHLYTYNKPETRTERRKRERRERKARRRNRT